MTRQEQKAVKELSEMISKNLKLVAREHGFKVVSDCAYKVLGDFLYEVFLSAPPIRHGTATGRSRTAAGTAVGASPPVMRATSTWPTPTMLGFTS